MQLSDEGYFAEAIENNDVFLVRQLLIERPSLIHQKIRDGLTPLLFAVSDLNYNRSVDCVRALLEAGANINDTDSCGYNAIHWAVGLEGIGWGQTARRIIRFLVEAGADLEGQHHYGWTPLMQALMEGIPEQVRYLLALGADPNKIFPSYALPAFTRGRSLLGIAMAMDKEYIVEQLIKAGADTSARDESNKTALQYAQQEFEESLRWNSNRITNA